jgi:hypothetical protein
MTIISGPKTCRRSSWTKVPIRSGRNFRVDSPPENALVTIDLARELERVLELFGMMSPRVPEYKVSIFFKPGIFGHHKVGRAVDIYAVDGLGLDAWKRLWDETFSRCSAIGNGSQRRAVLERERRKNLGWRLYKTLQHRGCWSQPSGLPIQLFGPWTRTEGPWKLISDFLLNAHRDHIHVAR